MASKWLLVDFTATNQYISISFVNKILRNHQQDGNAPSAAFVELEYARQI